jgi:hypothetical protein
MIDDGADIIDVGGESTRPGSDGPVSAEDEINSRRAGHPGTCEGFSRSHLCRYYKVRSRHGGPLQQALQSSTTSQHSF